MNLDMFLPMADEANRIMLAGVLGGLIGIERLIGDHPAGIRTCVLICVSSCLFTILSLSAFGNSENARVASEIVVGVGFLGGGCLIRAQNHVHGLTTAATIWTVAAIGMTVGTGHYSLAIFACLFSLGVLLFLAPVSKWVETTFGMGGNGDPGDDMAEGNGFPGTKKRAKRQK